MKYFWILSSFLIFSIEVPAQEYLTIEIASDPPFIIEENNRFTGFSVDLWKAIADSLKLDYRFVNLQSDSMIPNLIQKTVNLFIVPVSLEFNTPHELYYTEPFYISTMSVAVLKIHESGFLNYLSNVFSSKFLKTIGLLFLINFCVGFLMWIVERKKNAGEFPNTWLGLGDGFWWSWVTMTTVGYGDKVPRSGWGRLVGSIWMFVAVIIISGFTATISSELTANKLSKRIADISDLHGMMVGCLKNNNIAPYLDRLSIKTKTYNSMDEGIEALKNGDIEAFVDVDAILAYYLDHNTKGIDLINLPNNKEYLCFASSDKNLVDTVDPILLKIIKSPEWYALLKKYGLF